MSAPEATLPPEAYEECGRCGHYPAYCTPGGTSCSAWVADKTPSGYCNCKGRTEKARPAPVEQKPWGHERKDLQG